MASVEGGGSQAGGPSRGHRNGVGPIGSVEGGGSVRPVAPAGGRGVGRGQRLQLPGASRFGGGRVEGHAGGWGGEAGVAGRSCSGGVG